MGQRYSLPQATVQVERYSGEVARTLARVSKYRRGSQVTAQEMGGSLEHLAFAHGLRRGLHSYAASRLGPDAIGLPHRNTFSGQIAICTGPLSRQRGVTILLGPYSS
jgi:hypothetical protein